MENQQPQTLNQAENSEMYPTVRLCWEIFLKTWKWFVLSVLLSLVIAYLYSNSRTRIYQRQSVMLIEDSEGSGGGMGTSRSRRGAANAVMELNGISVGDNFKNELFIISSQRLMERVVDSLQLNVDYTTRTGLRTTTLYKRTPVVVDFDKIKDNDKDNDNVLSLTIRVLGNGRFQLSNFNLNGTSTEQTITAQAETPVRTPIGTLTLHSTPQTAGFPADQDVQVSRTPIKMAAKRFRSELSAAEYDKESSLVLLTCNDNSEQRAEDLLNEVFRAYKNDVVENKNRVAQNTAAFIDERIGIIGAELSNVEGEMAKFKQQNHLVNLQQTAQAVVSEAANARNKVIEAETQLQVARYLLEFLRDQSKAKQLIPALSVPAADAQIAQYNTQMNERNRLAANASEATQPSAELDRQLSALRTSSISSVQGYVRTIELQVNEARATEAALNGQVSAAPEKEKQALGIERQQALKAALYTYLLNKREEVALQLAINEANVRIVEYPMGSSIPVSPVHRNIVLIALVIGLCLPAGIIYLRRLFDTTIDGREDVEKLTSIPILGELPHWQQPNGNALISECEPTESIVEAFRVLRHGIHFLRRDARVFICTSSTPGQGKTFVSTNIAVALAMTGKRVLLVDGDIRRRTLSCKFRSTAGLTGILIEEDDAPISLSENVVVDAIYKGVDLLPSGIQPPNPAELLMSERLEKFVEVARASYDYIIFDATPAFAVADAEILSRVSDLMLYIIRVGVQDRNFLPDLEKFHKSGRFKNIGFIINDADKKTSIGFGYGYGYGYPHKKRG